MKRIVLALAAALVLAACGGKSPAAPTPTPEAQGVSLTYGEAAQIELVSPGGRVVFIDVANTAALAHDPSADDILLTTHLHHDHYYPAFQEAFPGQQLFASEGRIELPDVTVTGVAASHIPGDPIRVEGASNYIYIIEMGGLRIAHLGDIGQEALSEAQLDAVGQVDLLITQLANSFSLMNATNLMGFNLIDQVGPRLILPTHTDNKTLVIAVDRWPGYYSESRTVTISAGNLPDETSVLLLGTIAPAFGALQGLELWK
jgi:hypothetical protein